MSSPKLNILISGCGPAGTVCAYFLGIAGHKVTVLERAPELRKAGQQIDVRGAGVTVLKRMGTLDAVRAVTIQEKGLTFVNEQGKTVAEFPVDEKEGRSFSSDIEILREPLVKVFYDAAKRETTTEFLFGDYVTALDDDGKKVTVTLNSGSKKDFDLVIGADGLSSKIRRLMYPELENTLKSMGQYTAFFTIPYRLTEGDFAKWYTAPQGRHVLLRPNNTGGTGGYLSMATEKPAGYQKMSIPEQKAMFRELFKGAGWITDKVLDGMDVSDDFYMTEIAQVKIPDSAWSKGRVTLLGDAAYCPSPITGMGTTTALVGAYILAGEIVSEAATTQAGCTVDVEKALKNYDIKMKPYADAAQKVTPGRNLLQPQSGVGVKLLNGFLWTVKTSGLVALLQKVFTGSHKETEPLYEYNFGQSKV